MESKRQKFFKNNIIKQKSKSQNTRKKEIKASEQLNKPKQSTIQRDSPSNVEVTLIGSPSYNEQNRSISIFRNESKTDVENNQMLIEDHDEQNIIDIDNVQEEKHSDVDTSCKSNISENTTDVVEQRQVIIIDNVQEGKNSDKVTSCHLNISENTTDEVEQSHVNVKDYYNSFIRIEFELEEDKAEEDSSHIPTESKNNNRKSTEADTKENTTEKTEKCVESRTTAGIYKDTTRIIENIKEKHHESITWTEQQENNIEETEKSIEESEESHKNKTILSKLNPVTEPILDNEHDASIKSLEDNNDGDKDEPRPSAAISKQTKKSKRKINQSYVDFLSEDEDFFWDSTSWKETGDDTSSSEKDEPKKKKKKKVAKDGKVGEEGIRIKKTNKRKLKKELKAKGESYVKKDGIIVKEKELKPNPCIGKNCGHKCNEVTQEKRQALFTYFWNLSSQRKKDWLVTMSSKKDIIRKRSKDSSYRQQTFNYFINDGEGRRQVCQKFIINTLDITQRYIYYTLTTAIQGIAKEDARGKTVPPNKTPDLVKQSAVDFIKKLPALPSHYCRKDTTKLYLPTEFRNIKNLYRIYKEELLNKGLNVVNEVMFRDIFNKQFNIGFHVPKKDKCLKCMKYEGQDIENIPELQQHIAEKKASKTRLECHREIGKDNPSILCTSFDLQKVLNTPHGKSMLLFYSRKYAVYNLCFYESVSRNGFCYVWGETEGKRGGNEVATILQKYVEDVDSRGTIKTLILYSDCCPGQNRNKIVLAALHNALLHSKNIETLQMNYLLPGHTEMTVDSIHATIESSIRNTTVWAPSQWISICQLARKEPRPYVVEALTHDDFKSFDNLSDKYFKGNLAGKINKIRTATFKKSSPSVMRIKFSMQKDAQEEKVNILAKPKAITSSYKASLPITKTKYNDLKKLCETGTIPRIFHNEYLRLPTHNGRDELLDTDIEDEIEVKE